MYYAIFDTQCSRYMATGFNLTDINEVAEAYVSYKSIDTDEEWLREEIHIRGLDSVLYEDDFELEMQEEPFADNLIW